ncbi:MAG: Uma2 family endonuclease [Cyanobacteria bacterium P01_G01_bin.54]
MNLTLSPPSDRCLTFSDVGWLQFQTIVTAFDTVAGIRFAYLDGTLDIMTNSFDHEEYKKTIAVLLEAYLRVSGIRFYAQGSPMLGSEAQQARKEPDECYSLAIKKTIPDLAIEVIFTSGGVDKLKLYQRLGVPEVWLWEDGVLQVYELTDVGYQQRHQSKLLPKLDLTLLSRHITYHDQFDAVTEFLAALAQEDAAS